MCRIENRWTCPKESIEQGAQHGLPHSTSRAALTQRSRYRLGESMVAGETTLTHPESEPRSTAVGPPCIGRVDDRDVTRNAPAFLARVVMLSVPSLNTVALPVVPEVGPARASRSPR